MTNKKTKILCILDGFGLAPASPNNCAFKADMPTFRRLLRDYKWTTLNADGDCVGQETGLVGNSEVGHMNIGGLKMVPQLSYQITQSAKSNFSVDKKTAPDQIFDPKEFLRQKFVSSDKTIHLIGLFSKGQIHSDLRHWAGAIQSAGVAGAEKIILHIISDGRDSDRQSLVETWEYFAKTFGDRIQAYESKIYLGSLGGRFYTMDRDKNCDRVRDGIEVMMQPKGVFYHHDKIHGELCKYFLSQRGEKVEYQGIAEAINYNPRYIDEFYEKHTDDFDRFLDKLVYYADKFSSFETIRNQLSEIVKINYKNEIFDENIRPICFDTVGFREYDDEFSILPGQFVWLLNFRTDRMKQFAQMLCKINQEFELNLNIIAMNNYGIGNELVDTGTDTSSGYFPIFSNQPVQNTLAQTISEAGKTQLHIAETEKYNHVTYFLNGGQNKKWPGEDWVVIDSNKVDSHAQKPEMKAEEVTNYILQNGLGKYDYIIVNYANPDMVGHTGDIAAGIESMEFLDKQLGRLVDAIEQGDHSMLVTADHGNIEFVGGFVYGGKKLIDTEHNSNPVPLIFVQKSLHAKGLIDTISQFCSNQKMSFDLLGLQNALEAQNQIDLTSDTSKWLTSDTIPRPHLPLWYCGLILVNL